MDVRRLLLIYFSPTDTTRRVLEDIARGLAPDGIRRIDMTLPEFEETGAPDLEGDLALIGVPVYAGRVPSLAADRLRQLRGGGMPAAVVVVYGNRAYDDALVELRDLAGGLDFKPVAGGAFIGEHSFASQELPIANNRPDQMDATIAAAFGLEIKEMLAAADRLEDLPPLEVPGNVPYREGMEKKHIAPAVDSELCTICGICAAKCPSGSIRIEATVQADPESCLLCHACVKICPTEAIAFQAPPLREIAEKLSQNCRERLKPETFLAS